MKSWKDSMSGENENKVIEAIESCGYEFNKDFVRQYPIADAIVIDIAFINEKLAIEVDGRSHNKRGQAKKDEARDRFLIRNRWVPLRITDKQFNGNPSFFKHLIRELVEERRKQAESGDLYDVDIPEFILEDN